MSEESKMNAILLLSNTIRIIAFVVLAIVFKHWWIVLFSALFLSSWNDEDDKEDENKEEEK